MSAAALHLDAQPLPLHSIVATRFLLSRPSRRANRNAEITALRALTSVLAQDRSKALKCLAGLAVSLCNAGTAGVSLLEESPDGEIFRWHALAGKLAAYEGGSTPRNFSPCGSCLDAGKAVLYAYPARRFTYFAQLDTPIVEGLVIPMYAHGAALGTIWIVSHDNSRAFDAEDVRIMNSLGNFAAAAVAPASSGVTRVPPPGGGASASDREIVWRDYLQRIARNDQSALDALFEEARPLIFSAALRIVGLPPDADEVTADVMARVWSSAYTYDEQRGTATGWMLAIARNLSFDLLRMRAPEVRSPEGLMFETGSTARPLDRWLLDQRSSSVREALNALPADQRRVIELAYLAELSHAEVAKHLGEPLGTVKTRIRLGMIRLRASLAVLEPQGG